MFPKPEIQDLQEKQIRKMSLVSLSLNVFNSNNSSSSECQGGRKPLCEFSCCSVVIKIKGKNIQSGVETYLDMLNLRYDRFRIRTQEAKTVCTKTLWFLQV